LDESGFEGVCAEVEIDASTSEFRRKCRVQIEVVVQDIPDRYLYSGTGRFPPRRKAVAYVVNARAPFRGISSLDLATIEMYKLRKAWKRAKLFIALPPGRRELLSVEVPMNSSGRIVEPKPGDVPRKHE